MYYATALRVPGHKAHSSQIAQMCRAFAVNGVDVTLLVAERHTHGPVSVSEYYGFDRPVQREQVPTVDFFTRLPPSAPKSLVKMAHYVFVSTFSRNLIARLKKEHGPYVLFTRDPSIASTAQKLLPPERICLELHMVPADSDAAGLREYARAVDSAGGCITVTGGMRDWLVERGVPRESILVKPNAIDPRAFPGSVDAMQARRELGLPGDRKIVMFVGNLTAVGTGRGLDTLFAALGSLATGREDLFLCIVGARGAEQEQFRNLAARSGLKEDQLSIVERQPYDGLYRWMSAADILVHPLPSHRIYNHVTSPLKIFEYRTSGRPIVASDLPSIREILEDGRDALLAKPDDPRSLAGAIERLLEDPGLAATLAEESLRRARGWTWEARAGQILQWLECRLQSNKGSSAASTAVPCR